MSINPVNFDITRFQQNQALQSAIHTGQAGQKGMEQHKGISKDLEENDSLHQTLLTDFLEENHETTKFPDGRCVTKAPNGMVRQEYPDGTLEVTLPNGKLMQRDPEGNTVGFDPATGNSFDVEAFKEHPEGQYYFKFQDAENSTYTVSSNTLRFEVTNEARTITEKIQHDGDITIKARTDYREPDSMHFKSDIQRLSIKTDGTAKETDGHPDNVYVDNKSLQYTNPQGIKMIMPLPYMVPHAVQSPGDPVCPCPQPPAPQPPPAPPTPAPPPPAPAPAPPAPAPAPPAPAPAPGGPTAPILSVSGVERVGAADGSTYTCLPNAIVLQQMPDGTAFAYDQRKPDAAIPVKVSEVKSAAGQEKEYVFTDAAGNECQMYSKSFDFMMTSKNQDLSQVVFPDGKILICASTTAPGVDGKPVVTLHKAEVLPNGQINTFGEKGMSVGSDSISFADGKQSATLPLCYNIPPYQSFLSQMPSPPLMRGPSSGIMPDGAILAPGNMPTQPSAPTVPQTPTPPADKPVSGEQPSQPVHKGIWQRIKGFFGFGDKPPVKTPSYPSGSYSCNPSGCNQYEGLEKMMKVQTAITGVSALAMLGMTFATTLGGFGGMGMGSMGGMGMGMGMGMLGGMGLGMMMSFPSMMYMPRMF